jgi:phage shock protein A
MTTDDMQARITTLQQEYTRGEDTLLRLRPQVRQLEDTLERLRGGILTLQAVLLAEQQAQERVPTPNGYASAHVPE